MSTPATLCAQRLRLGYDQHVVVDDLDLEVPTGRITAVVGPNGCGKSTLLRGLGRLLPAQSGRVLLAGQDLRRTPGRRVARQLALLPQQPVAPEGITVADLVSRGRYPHQGAFSRLSAEDERVVAWALSTTDTAELGQARVDELSGGQQQRVWIAMVLAQQPGILLLDEPTTYLDVAHQVEVLDLLDRLNATEGTTVLMVLHELNLAARYADHMVLMDAGRIHTQGAPATVLDEESVRHAFALDCRVVPDPVTGDPMVVPCATRSRGAVPDGGHPGDRAETRLG